MRGRRYAEVARNFSSFELVRLLGSPQVSHGYFDESDHTMDGAASSASLIEDWHAELRRHPLHDHPNYFANDLSRLVTESVVQNFRIGIGDDIYSSILPTVETAELEVIFVTCFWAKSTSLERLSNTLQALSTKAIERKGPKIRVRICFSSLSILQKLFHTSSPAGHVYPSSTWAKKLGLPPPEDLIGLDLEIKSVFIRPFSVMHPKFIVIDRARVWLPSCNVSWEAWFEGCIELSGPVVEQFVRFWKAFWAKESERQESLPDTRLQMDESVVQDHTDDAETVQRVAGSFPAIVRLDTLGPVPTVFLPSPHHVNPRFRPLPWQSAPDAPPTPLNTFTIQLFGSATSNIYVQTPNVTSPPVLTALLRALQRGVNVHIVTSERLMILEQLGTAGTTTARCIKKLIKRYKRLSSASFSASALEAGVPRLGRLCIEYYCSQHSNSPHQPTQSHLKLTVVDAVWIILGSGNMDRASWYTSQELGVALCSHGVAAAVHGIVRRGLEGRTKVVHA